MNREQIISMAREANRYADTHADSTDCDWPLIRDEHFAALVAAAEHKRVQKVYTDAATDSVKAAILYEREACAKVCEQMDHNGVMIAADCAAAIRARRNT